MLNAPADVGEKHAMLGLRLEPELQRQLASHARRTGRTKSEIAREAVRDYLVRHDEEAEFKRQVKLLNDSYASDHDGSVVARTGDWLRSLDEEDGGYDWGKAGPPE